MTGKRPVWSLGAMSGTSLDGVDAALIRTDGEEILEFGDSAYAAYSEGDRAAIQQALGQWSGAMVDAAAEVVENTHAELLSQFPTAELAGFHGQTTIHQPDIGETCQIGNGAVLAEVLGLPVVWDFRTNDMKMGGQGAPLAPFFHFALAKWIKATAPIVFLNIGGVANVTFVDPTKSRPDENGALLAFDTGPGNARMDDVVQARVGKRMDQDGALAAAGAVHGDILDRLLHEERYFSRLPPKSLDRNDFSGWADAVAGLSVEDAIATLAAGTAGSIARSFEHLPSVPQRVVVTGGGRNNPALMEMIGALLPCQLVSAESVGLDGDMIEAQAFAYLAVRVLHGLPTSAPGTTGVAAPVGGGHVSRPGDLKV